jgi:beta-glucosidase/6-phospho-beta-glucosidase/beta-galactosidase
MPDEISQDPLAQTDETPISFIGAFESTYMPGHDLDVAELTGHAAVWREDLDALAQTGVRQIRYPLRWHRIEPRPGELCFSETDAVLHYMQDLGLQPIVDLVHHTSYPSWLEDGFRDRRFSGAYIRFAEAVAQRYPWLNAYTLFNEPFATLFLSGHEALWPPYDHGIEGFVRLVRNILPAVSEASIIWSALLPKAQHIWVDTCEHHAGSVGGPAAYADLANDRRHVLLDLALGHDLDRERPFLKQVLSAGGENLLGLPPIRVDVLGLDYYCHSEWWYDEEGSHSPSPRPLGFAALAEQYSKRYGLPMLLSETNLRGLPSDRASWLRYTLEQYEIAVNRGVPLQGYCWFPYVDSCDWDSLLSRPAGRADPVGVVSAGDGAARQRTSFTGLWEAAAAGKPAAELPAYRFQSPCDIQLAGLLPQMRHWEWTDPPTHDVIPPVLINSGEGATDAAQL